ncbi:hypothetical protein RHSIM_Rhsim08G0104900 [Rhododendron simsii]|uniref:Autophagy-related protein 101 n=1 Tax=Rhododendron simsii TaxID=118357 RepID=A0A834LGW7_RHOSS|nr:hypothetical protein RHSIM_Rhsim08G0104900 [Rhododendron simsii]
MNCEVCPLKELELEHFEVREVLRCVLHTIFFHRALGLVRPKDVDLELFDITYVQCGDLDLEKKIEEKIDQFIDRVEKHPNKKYQAEEIVKQSASRDCGFNAEGRETVSWIVDSGSSRVSVLQSARTGLGLICLSFYEVKNKPGTWFPKKLERLYWEQWEINLNVVQQQKAHSSKSHHSKVVVDPGESAAEEINIRRAALESSLREVLFQIIKFVNEKKDHVPPIPNLDGISFPYEITIPGSSVQGNRFCACGHAYLLRMQSIGSRSLASNPDFPSSDSAFGMDMFKRMLQTGHPTMLS